MRISLSDDFTRVQLQGIGLLTWYMVMVFGQRCNNICAWIALWPGVLRKTKSYLFADGRMHWMKKIVLLQGGLARCSQEKL